MPRQQSKAQKDTVRRVMHEFKRGKLDTSRGKKVKNRRQAIAIALHEAGASKDESRKKNAENLKRTKARERKGETAAARKPARRSGRRERTRAELYAEAKRRKIPGRSKMDKDALRQALHA
ncbi:MAG TPA: DUF6496 domain-containing protein [Stellaceae bacterium]|nr:DUF6496 domain-containing protein [Stellaceae bacterium]